MLFLDFSTIKVLNKFKKLFIFRPCKFSQFFMLFPENLPAYCKYTTNVVPKIKTPTQKNDKKSAKTFDGHI